MALSGNIPQFSYGLLFGNENYHRVPPEEIRRTLNDGYSNNHVEITYAANNSILALKTHRGFKYEKDKAHSTKRLKMNLEDVSQNVYEICDVIYMRKRMQRLHNRLKKSDASFIKDALLNIARYIERDLFHLSELDRKVNYIFKNLGIEEEFESLVRVGELSSKSIEIKEVQKTNTYVISLAVITAVLTSIQIFQNISCSYKFTSIKTPSCDTLGLCIQLDKLIDFLVSLNCKTIMCNNLCNTVSPIIQLDGFAVILFLLLLILMGIVFILASIYRKKRYEEIRQIVYEIQNEE